jgi:galactose mutarotase-like enzyme
MDRKNKPSTIPISPSLPQPVVDVSDDTVTATLPTHDTVTINLFGATVTSWTCGGDSTEQLFLSTAAHLDATKAIRGGIPIVFPVFGPPPAAHATGKLPQHGFARSTLWEFLGKNTSESSRGKRGGDEEVKLDFGLSSGMLAEEMREKWPCEFGLVYSVTLGKGTLETWLHVQNKGGEMFEFQALFHNYFKIEVGRCSHLCPLSCPSVGLYLTLPRRKREGEIDLKSHADDITRRISPKSQSTVSNPRATSTKSPLPPPNTHPSNHSPSPRKQTASIPPSTPPSPSRSRSLDNRN